jgi:hypothetical protein
MSFRLAAVLLHGHLPVLAQPRALPIPISVVRSFPSAPIPFLSADTRASAPRNSPLPPGPPAEAAAAAAAAAAGAPQVATTPGGEVVEIDDWLIDFANLFRDVSGVDAERHVEIQNEGWAGPGVSGFWGFRVAGRIFDLWDLGVSGAPARCFCGGLGRERRAVLGPALPQGEACVAKSRARGTVPALSSVSVHGGGGQPGEHPCRGSTSRKAVS